MTARQAGPEYEVPFGREVVRFRGPAGVVVATAGSAPASRTPLPATQQAAAAIGAPVSSPPLRELAAGARLVVIAVTDATRACPDWLLVPPMLGELAAAGVSDDAITILVAVGVHRASTAAEKREKLGDAIVDRYRVVDHDATDIDNLVAVAEGPGGIPFRINRRVAEADLVIATGLVEPHQYAGFSGGGKTVAIGCASDAIIAYTHGPAFLDDPGTRLARVEGNRFQSEVRRVAEAAGVRFVANCVMDDHGQVVAVRYGDPVAVHDELASVARDLFTVAIPSQVDIAVAGVGYPKDENLYQASRAASYLQFAPVPVVRPGGVIIIPAACREGPGEGAGERRFAETMRSKCRPQIIAEARENGIAPGQQRAYVMARVLEEVTVIVAGALDPASIEELGFLTAPTVEAALDDAVRITGTPASMLVVPHALLTLPIVAAPK